MFNLTLFISTVTLDVENLPFSHATPESFTVLVPAFSLIGWDSSVKSWYEPRKLDMNMEETFFKFILQGSLLKMIHDASKKSPCLAL